jgi:hypothetical protein
MPLQHRFVGLIRGFMEAAGIEPADGSRQAVVRGEDGLRLHLNRTMPKREVGRTLLSKRAGGLSGAPT